MKADRIELNKVTILAPQSKACKLEPDVSETSTTITKEALDPASEATLQREATVAKAPVGISTPFKIVNSFGEVSLSPNDLRNNGHIVILVTGPFCIGKDTVTNKLIQENPLSLAKPIKYTTREKRKSEFQGNPYYFITEEDFEKMKEDKILAQWLKVNNLQTYYGISIKSLQEIFDSDKDVIIPSTKEEIGSFKRTLSSCNIPYVEIFLSPASKEELKSEEDIENAVQFVEAKIIERGKEQDHEERITKSRNWLTEAHTYENVVKNTWGKLDQTVANIWQIIQAKKAELSLIGAQDKHPALLEFEITGSVSESYLKDLKLKSNGNFVVILSGPPGAGKGTILNEVFKDSTLNLEKVINHTTRSPRPNESHGVDYFFVTKEEFKRKIKNNELIEWIVVVNGNYYGSSEEQIQKIFNASKNPLFDIDIHTSHFYRYIFKKLGIPYVDIFVSPVPKEELSTSSGLEKAKEILRSRMIARGGAETSREIEERVNKSIEYLKAAHTFTHIIENLDGSLEASIQQFKKIIH